MKRTAKKSWTVMVYMAGDNNLDPEGEKDLIEMKKVGSTEQINVIAQFDRKKGHVARRYYLRQGGIVTGDAVASLGASNTGDPKSLADFIQWGFENYPAEHYLVVLWNHGQGWDDTDVYAGERFRRLRRLATGPCRHAFFHSPVRQILEKARDGDSKARAILLDDNAKDFLDNLEMKKVLADAAKSLGRKIDILGMDACLMSMAEVGYQIRDSVDFTVGSEDTEPGAGWPYDTILKALAKKPKMSPRDLSSLIVEKYICSYPDPGEITLSACDLSRAEVLADAVSGLAEALTVGMKNSALRDGILTARGYAKSFAVSENVDLADLCLWLRLKCADDPAIEAASQAVTDAVEEGYVIEQDYEAMTFSNGVAIYFPIHDISPLYQRLDFSKKTGWGDFLKVFLGAIRKRKS